MIAKYTQKYIDITYIHIHILRLLKKATKNDKNDSTQSQKRSKTPNNDDKKNGKT